MLLLSGTNGRDNFNLTALFLGLNSDADGKFRTLRFLMWLLYYIGLHFCKT